MILYILKRYWLVLVLVLCVLINVGIYWPRKNGPRDGRPPGPPGMAQGQNGNNEERMQKMLSSLPEDQRQEVESHMKKTREFMESVSNLSESERREKMGEYFQQNPPPRIAGMPGPGGRGNGEGEMPPGGGPGGEGGGGTGQEGNKQDGNRGPGGPGGNRVPPVEQRKQMDKRIAQTQREAKQQSQTESEGGQ